MVVVVGEEDDCFVLLVEVGVEEGVVDSFADELEGGEDGFIESNSVLLVDV